MAEQLEFGGVRDPAVAFSADRGTRLGAADDLGAHEDVRLVDLFGGSADTQRWYQPSWLLATHRYTGVTAWFAAGRQDPKRKTAAAMLAKAGRTAGIETHAFEVPGGHTWTFVRDALDRLFPQFVRDLGLCDLPDPATAPAPCPLGDPPGSEPLPGVQLPPGPGRPAPPPPTAKDDRPPRP